MDVRYILLDFFMTLILIAAIWTAALRFSVLLQCFEEARIQRIYRIIQKMVRNPALLNRIMIISPVLDQEKFNFESAGTGLL